MTDENEPLPSENELVLCIVQAMIGSLSSAVMGLALERKDAKVVLYVLAGPDLPAAQADIEDLMGELEAVLWPRTPLVEVQFSQDIAGWQGRQHRLVYSVKVPYEDET